MGLLNYFRKERSQGTATVAKERLQILVAHDRAERSRPPYLMNMKRDILDVIRKYVEVDLDDVSVNYEQDDDRETLEVNVVLPDAGEGRG